MAATKVKYVMEGPHKGKDFVPRNHPTFQFVKGVFEATVDAAAVPAMDRILGGYGAKRTDAADESKPAAKAPAKKKTTTKKPAAKKAEVDDAAKKDAATDSDVQPTGTGAEQSDAANGGSDDNADSGKTGNAASEQDGAGSANEEEMI